MNRATLKSFKKEAFKRKGVKEQYDELAPAYEIRKKLIALRQQAGLTQEQIAKKLQTYDKETVNCEVEVAKMRKELQDTIAKLKQE